MDNTPVHTTTIQRMIIAHPDGTITTLGGTDERSTLDENGGHEYAKTDITIATLDGHVLKNGDVAHQCPTCKTGPWSTHAMSVCNGCHRLVCLPCTTTSSAGTLCGSCNAILRRHAFKQWLCSIF